MFENGIDISLKVLNLVGNIVVNILLGIIVCFVDLKL